MFINTFSSVGLKWFFLFKHFIAYAIVIVIIVISKRYSNVIKKKFQKLNEKNILVDFLHHGLFDDLSLWFNFKVGSQE